LALCSISQNIEHNPKNTPIAPLKQIAHHNFLVNSHNTPQTHTTIKYPHLHTTVTRSTPHATPNTEKLLTTPLTNTSTTLKHKTTNITQEHQSKKSPTDQAIADHLLPLHQTSTTTYNNNNQHPPPTNPTKKSMPSKIDHQNKTKDMSAMSSNTNHTVKLEKDSIEKNSPTTPEATIDLTNSPINTPPPTSPL
jgi:hypothetical protein